MPTGTVGNNSNVRSLWPRNGHRRRHHRRQAARRRQQRLGAHAAIVGRRRPRRVVGRCDREVSGPFVWVDYLRQFAVRVDFFNPAFAALRKDAFNGERLSSFLYPVSLSFRYYFDDLSFRSVALAAYLFHLVRFLAS